MRGEEIKCLECGTPFVKKRMDQFFCTPKCWSRKYNRKRPKVPPALRECRNCGHSFSWQGQSSNRQYCSSECSLMGAKKSRASFHKRNTEYHKTMWHRHKHKDPRSRKGKGVVEWLRRRHPDLPQGCESCGESRVLDVAHKPEFARNGAWRSRTTTQRHMFWVLCPTCHALLDRNVCSPQQLGLRTTLV